MAAVASEKMVDPTPSSIPPISQSMDSNNSPRRFSCDTPPSGAPETEPLDRSSPSTPSPSRQLEPQLSGQSLSKVEEYRQLFRLPPDEVLVQDFNCAFQENFLIQGHMYLFVHNICFYSNLFGFETKKIIPFHEITSVRRANVVGVFPTAIEILAGGKKYFFTSFLSRDEAYKIINDGWLQHSNGPNEITDHQEPKYDISSQENGKAIVEESSGSRLSTDESQIIERVENAPTSEDGKLFGDGGPNIVSTSLNVQVREEENAEAARNSECSSSAKSSAWEPEDADAPGVPECYIKVAESKFPTMVSVSRSYFMENVAIKISRVLRGDLMKHLGTSVMCHFNIQLKFTLVQDLVAVKRLRNIEFTGTGKSMLLYENSVIFGVDKSSLVELLLLPFSLFQT
ncbi:hypothetical protein ACJIZ3_016268 [Penstemon smallii]|uniref:GRAM domain-containing protein n=1 Tax=Penstemon smallii TaxID=265156 RepID=A0ABD3RPW3_9LAMI